MNNYKNRTESNISILSPEQYIAVCEASYKHPLGFLIRILMYTGITVVELRLLNYWCFLGVILTLIETACKFHSCMFQRIMVL